MAWNSLLSILRKGLELELIHPADYVGIKFDWIGWVKWIETTNLEAFESGHGVTLNSNRDVGMRIWKQPKSTIK